MKSSRRLRNDCNEGVDLLYVYIISVGGADVFANLLWLVAQHIVQGTTGCGCIGDFEN